MWRSAGILARGPPRPGPCPARGGLRAPVAAALATRERLEDSLRADSLTLVSAATLLTALILLVTAAAVALEPGRRLPRGR
ncbi:hypothetical protein [Nonomuraea dietziae]|uniref:hypothetical protein n=1 Tax=Nonomuraea dietziae TaxID=65515 RepID=UPI0031DBFB3E